MKRSGYKLSPAPTTYRATGGVSFVVRTVLYYSYHAA